MSDRRRYPYPDEWDDDLDLAGFEKQSRSEEPSARHGRNPAQPEPNAHAFELDEDSESIDRAQRGTRSRRAQPRADLTSADRRRYRSDDDRYGGQQGGYDPFEDQPYRGPRAAQPASSSRRQPRQDYEYGEFDESAAYRSPDAVSARGQRYPSAGYPLEDAQAGMPPVRRRRPRTRDEIRQRPVVAVPRPSISDGLAVGVVGLSLLSLVLMIASIAAGAGDLPDWFPVHLNASGDADRWGNDSWLWRIPFGSFMALLMSLVIAFFVWKRDRFAARFALSGTAAVQILAWIALVDFLW